MSRRWLAMGLTGGLVVALGIAGGLAAQGWMASAHAVEPPKTDAQHVYIVDYNTGSVLYDKMGEEKLHPASMS